MFRKAISRGKWLVLVGVVVGTALWMGASAAKAQANAIWTLVSKSQPEIHGVRKDVLLFFEENSVRYTIAHGRSAGWKILLEWSEPYPTTVNPGAEVSIIIRARVLQAAPGFRHAAIGVTWSPAAKRVDASAGRSGQTGQIYGQEDVGRFRFGEGTRDEVKINVWLSDGGDTQVDLATYVYRKQVGPAGNRPPRAPTLIGPDNTYSPGLDPYSITFQWQNNGDPDGDAVGFYLNIFQYDFYSAQWVLVYKGAVEGTSTTLYNFQEFSYYAWRVFAVDWSQRSDPWFTASDWSFFSTVPGFAMIEEPPPPPTDELETPAPPGRTIEEAVDENDNNKIDDNEIMNAVNYWISGEGVPGTDGQTISDEKILELVNMWIGGRPVSSSSAKSEMVKAKELVVEKIKVFPNPLGSMHAATFKVEGTRIASMKVEIFSLAGMKVFEQETSGSTLGFHAIDDEDRQLANGVYLYVVTVKGYDGQVVRSKVKKLVVLR